MRRTLPLIGLGSLFLLASCARASELPPDEVLKRAVAAGNQMESAAFSMDADIQLFLPDMPGRAKIHMDGVLQDGGEVTQFSFSGDGAVTQGGQPLGGTVQGDIISEQSHALYFKLNKASLSPEHPLFTQESIGKILGTWWMIPQGESAAAAKVTPDPSLLRAQSEVVAVTKDRGIVKYGNEGSEAYHYDVTLDPAKFAAFLGKLASQRDGVFDETIVAKDLASYDAKGELWIDADTFMVHEVSWDIGPRQGKSAPYGLKLDVKLRDHNAATPVSLPSDARIYPGFGSGSSLPSASSSTAPVTTPSSSSASSVRS